MFSGITQNVGVNNPTPDVNATLDVKATNKGILIPRIDYLARPTGSVIAGMLIYVTVNGPSGNNAFYYYNGTDWVKFTLQPENQSLSLNGVSLTISGSNTISLGDTFPIQGYIKCGSIYINPYQNNNNCGSCGNVCPVGKTCVNGSCQ